LAGVLTRIEAAARLRNGDLSPDSIQQRLDDATRPPVTIAEVAKQVARHCNLTRTALRDRGRAQNVSLARQLAMYLSRKLTGASHRAIGDYFGRRDHSTVLHACRRIAELLPADTRLRHLSATIEQGLHDG
jgi:chromosomal replication initiator protein